MFWQPGIAPKNAEAVPDAQLDEEYSSVQPPLYSTLPDAEDIQAIPGCQNIRMASRTNQRIIMVNQGANNKGFMVCPDCGAAMPGDDGNTFVKEVKNPVKQVKRQIYILAKYLEGYNVWVEGYVILIRSNSPVQSTYILQSVEDIDRAIHTFKRNHLSRDTVESIKKMLV